MKRVMSCFWQLLVFCSVLPSLCAAAAPSINSFSASRPVTSACRPVELQWDVSGAAALSIVGLGGVSGSSVMVNPASTTNYTLIASNADGSVSATVAVSVRLLDFSSSPNLADPDLFDWGFYRDQHTALTGFTELTPEATVRAHYASSAGLTAGLQGHLRFDVEQYRRQIGAVAIAACTRAAAATDYLLFGRKQGDQGLIAKPFQEFLTDFTALRQLSAPKPYNPVFDYQDVAIGADGTRFPITVNGPNQIGLARNILTTFPAATFRDSMTAALNAVRASSGPGGSVNPATTITRLFLPPTTPPTILQLVPLPTGTAATTAFLDIRNVHDLEIDLGGATLSAMEARTVMSTLGLTRVKFKNFQIDYALPVHARGEIRREAGQSYLHVFPTVPSIPQSARIIGVSGFDFATNKWRTGVGTVNTRNGAAPTFWRVDAAGDGGNEYTFPGFSIYDNFAVPLPVMVRLYGEGQNAIEIGSGNDVSLESVSVYNSPYMSFKASTGFGSGLLLKNCNVMRSPVRVADNAAINRYLASNIDAINIENTSDVIIRGGNYGHIGDDGVNLHVRPDTIASISLSNRVQTIAPMSGATDMSASIFAFTPAMGYLGRFPISNVSSANGGTQFDLPTAVDGLVPYSRVVNAHRMASRFIISDVRFHDSLARGILLHMSNGMVRNNLVEYTQQPGLMATYELRVTDNIGPNVNINIRGNRFSNVNIGNGGKITERWRAAAIAVGADLPSHLSFANAPPPFSLAAKDVESQNGDYPQNALLNIANNVIENSPLLGIYVGTAHRVSLRNNELINVSTDLPTLAPAALLGGPISVERSHVGRITGPGISAANVYLEDATTSDFTLANEPALMFVDGFE
jgi:hypothetical protein